MIHSGVTYDVRRRISKFRQVKLQSALCTIEKRYASDLFTAGAMAEKPPLIHDEPEMIVTSTMPA